MSSAEEVKMQDELIAAIEAGEEARAAGDEASALEAEAREAELSAKLCSTVSGRKLLDGLLQSMLSAKMGSKKALERKN